LWDQQARLARCKLLRSMIQHLLQTQLTDSMAPDLRRKFDNRRSSWRICLLLWNLTHLLPLAQNFSTDFSPETVVPLTSHFSQLYFIIMYRVVSSNEMLEQNILIQFSCTALALHIMPIRPQHTISVCMHNSHLLLWRYSPGWALASIFFS
jgi:hypothetical protein